MRIRSFLRHVVLNFLSINSSPSNSVHILNGHYISKILTNSSKSFFDSFIVQIKNLFEIIDLDSAIDIIKKKERCNIPKVAITFDDGFEECYKIMLPILEKHNIKATFFINPLSIENNDSNYTNNFILNNLKVNLEKNIMDWKMLRELNNLGHTIGSHTNSHVSLKNLPNEVLDYEVVQSKYKIENEIGVPCKFFAFPFGNENFFDSKALDMVSKNYDFGFTSGNYKKYFFKKNKNILSRRHFECDIPLKHLIYFLSRKRTF